MTKKSSRIHALRCLAFLADDYRKSLRFALGRIETGSGTPHADFETEESVRYIEEVFSDYKRYGGVTRFRGRVAEIGPGDNCGVGLLFLADGCAEVDLCDRFYARRDKARQAAVYELLIERHAALRDRLAGADLTEESTFPGITRHYGRSASSEDFFTGRRGYDAIVSRAVLEHVTDPVRSLERMAGALKPGGIMLHKVDLRDHGMFSTRDHELKFLEVPAWLYRRMVRASGRPNRVLAHAYREACARLGLHSAVLVTHLAGVGEIAPHLPFDQIAEPLRRRSLEFVHSLRQGFCATFRDVSDETLCTAGFFLVARVPPA